MHLEIVHISLWFGVSVGDTNDGAWFAESPIPFRGALTNTSMTQVLAHRRVDIGSIHLLVRMCCCNVLCAVHKYGTSVDVSMRHNSYNTSYTVVGLWIACSTETTMKQKVLGLLLTGGLFSHAALQDRPVLGQEH